jgi:nucleotide sugar dehydrogenase
MKRISVVGFGKIGQAIVANMLKHDVHVNAVDINPALKQIFESKSYRSSEEGLETILNSSFAKGQLTISADFASVKDSAAVIVAIPLLVDKQKNVLDQPFLECFKNIGAHLKNGTVLVIETSIPVGYGRNTVIPVIEQTGSKHGSDFFLVHSPERIKSGTMLQQLVVTPKVIGGVTREAAERAAEIYRWFFDEKLIHVVDSIEAAEMIKLAGMAYRDINIALSNQLAVFAEKSGVPFSELIPLINTDGEAHLLSPGIGVGGHCTPVYPYFLIRNFAARGLQFDLASRARDINDQMASYAVSLAQNAGYASKNLILGLGFRPNIKEDTFSTSYLLKDALDAAHLPYLLHDTEFTENEISQKGFTPCANLYETGCDTAFLVTMHREYGEIDWRKMSSNGLKIIIDGRNALDQKTVEEAGIKYIGIGKN